MKSVLDLITETEATVQGRGYLWAGGDIRAWQVITRGVELGRNKTPFIPILNRFLLIDL